MSISLEAKIEAVLFFKGEPLSIKRLGEILKVSKEEIREALPRLRQSLEGRGVVLLEKDGEVTLGTTGEMSKVVEDLQKEELSRDLSKATLETLSIILYKGGATRSEIDFIRGVNSSFILRALSVRGLIEKITDPKDSRRFLYRPSFELISFMGVKNLEELPEYMEIKNAIDNTALNLAEEAKKEE